VGRISNSLVGSERQPKARFSRAQSRRFLRDAGMEIASHRSVSIMRRKAEGMAGTTNGFRVVAANLRNPRRKKSPTRSMAEAVYNHGLRIE